MTTPIALPPPPLVSGIAPVPSCKLLSHTYKYAPQCGDAAAGKQIFPLLITGTGRVGTLFVQTALTKMGLSFSHDNTAARLPVLCTSSHPPPPLSFKKNPSLAPCQPPEQ